MRREFVVGDAHQRVHRLVRESRAVGKSNRPRPSLSIPAVDGLHAGRNAEFRARDVLPPVVNHGVKQGDLSDAARIRLGQTNRAPPAETEADDIDRGKVEQNNPVIVLEKLGPIFRQRIGVGLQLSLAAAKP